MTIPLDLQARRREDPDDRFRDLRADAVAGISVMV